MAGFNKKALGLKGLGQFYKPLEALPGVPWLRIGGGASSFISKK
jgi:hypothetical protein